MPTPAWRVQFHRAAARDLRKLGADAESRVLRYLRERIAGREDPRRFGHALTGDRRGSGAIELAITESSPQSRMTDSWYWW